jgi:hypothetical protein
VRGAVIPITASFKALEGSIGTLNAAVFVGIVCLLLSFWAIWGVDETFSKELNYTETM